MKRAFIIVGCVVTIALCSWYGWRIFNVQVLDTSALLSSIPSIQENVTSANSNLPSNETSLSKIVPPMSRIEERIIQKPFGIFITPKTSPVQPEKFNGYHTGIDFEIFPEEAESDVPVVALCDGTLIEKRFATGYGGVVVTRCVLDNELVTIVYGHLSLASVAWKEGDALRAGEKIGLLGAGKSRDTDGERKHLHLGIHRGGAINLRGYVNTKIELTDWFDPYEVLQRGVSAK